MFTGRDTGLPLNPGIQYMSPVIGEPEKADGIGYLVTGDKILQ